MNFCPPPPYNTTNKTEMKKCKIISGWKGGWGGGGGSSWCISLVANKRYYRFFLQYNWSPVSKQQTEKLRQLQIFSCLTCFMHRTRQNMMINMYTWMPSFIHCENGQVCKSIALNKKYCHPLMS